MKKTPLLAALLLLVACSSNQVITDNSEGSSSAVEGRAEEQRPPVTMGAESAEGAVSAFYNALSMGNGSLAVQFIIPEKQETGNYVSSRMSSYYGELEQALKVERIDWVGESQRRVVYSYKEQGKGVCKDIMDVNVTKRINGWFIESIVPRQVCQTETPKTEAINTQPADQALTAVDASIKCVQFGQQEYQDIFLDDGSIEFEFFYSPTLETCLLQREEYGPGTAFAITLYDMFTKYLLVDYYNGGESMKCAAAKGLGQDVLCVSSLDEFNRAKATLLR